MSLLDKLFQAQCKRIATKLILFIETDKKIVLLKKKNLMLIVYLSILTSLVKCYLMFLYLDRAYDFKLSPLLE